MIIAIDGHSASGKSTLGKDIAHKLNYEFIDSGALYRVYGLLAFRQRISTEAEIHAFAEKSPQITFEYSYKNDSQNVQILLEKEDVSEKIRSKEISDYVPLISSHTLVRETVTKKIRDLAGKKDVVIDGRDIGSVVCPNADIKFFITADISIRAKRRLGDYGNNPKEYEEVLSSLKKRDKIDTERKIGNLFHSEDAFLVNTGEHTRESQLKYCLDIIIKYLNEN